ncbi:MAG: esterase-like activity of phytase family protein, partial [Cyanothece sp. SIO1E1]|nr:esterase-like activity of phytase family protein [Cyanothece sp. SIO1E1]
AEGKEPYPRQTVFISSEGVSRKGIAPFVNEFDLQTGEWRQSIPLPNRYLPDEGSQQGIQDNLGLEALTLNTSGSAASFNEPFRLFTATEFALAQDLDPAESDPAIRNRLLHYLIGEDEPVLIAEHLYPLAPPPAGTIAHGLVELLTLDQSGHFLSVERSFGLAGFNVKIFQIATGGATDTSNTASFRGDISGINPIQKQLVLDLKELGLTLDNLEGITLGPRLPDGSQSLILVSDDNFNEDQVTQFLLFSLNTN